MSDNAQLPPEVDLERLFHKKSVFDSTDNLRDLGFEILRESKSEKVVVASHRSAPGFLFKKFLSDVSLSWQEQLLVYEKRVNGARSLRDHLDKLRIEKITLPRKWLCELPPQFDRKHGGPSHIVVVERHAILDPEESARRYRRIDEDLLRDLCTILFTFRRVDFTPKNAPFIRDGRISFIDTGYLTRIKNKKNLSSRRKSYDKNINRIADLGSGGFSDKVLRNGKVLWNDFVKREDLLPASGTAGGQRGDGSRARA